MQSPDTGNRIAGVLKYLALLALAGVLLYFSFREVKWNDFIQGLESCNFWWILASMGIGILGFALRAFRWRLLLLPLGKEITVRESFDGVNIAYLTNFAVPRAGEIARCGVIAKTGKASFEGALGTVVLERSFDLVCLLLWILLLLAFRWNEFGAFMQKELLEPIFGRFHSMLWPVIAIFLAGALICALIWRFRRKLLAVPVFAKAVQIARGLGKGLLTAFSMKHKWQFILYTLAIWTTYWLTSYTTILAFPSVGHLNGVDALFLMIVGGLGWVVPVQGGLGAYHFIVSLALASVYGITQTTGVIFATISHEAQALTMIICGIASIISMSVWKKQIK